MKKTTWKLSRAAFDHLPISGMWRHLIANVYSLDSSSVSPTSKLTGEKWAEQPDHFCLTAESRLVCEHFFHCRVKIDINALSADAMKLCAGLRNVILLTLCKSDWTSCVVRSLAGKMGPALPIATSLVASYCFHIIHRNLILWPRVIRTTIVLPYFFQHYD